MKNLLLFLTVVALALTSQAAEWRTYTFTVTNGTSLGDLVYFDGTVRTGGLARTQYAWQTNANKNITASNIISQLGGWTIPGILVSQIETNVLVFKGADLVVTSTPFASITVVTQTLGPTRWGISAPASVFPPSLQQSNGSEIVNYLNATTNPITSTATGLLHFVGRTNVQTVLNKEITNSIVRKGTNDGTLTTNAPAIYATNLYPQVINADGSTSVLSGSISGGTLRGTSSTNAPWVNATNILGNTARFTTMLVTDGATITNLNAPGLGANSQRIGDSSDASGAESIAIGHNANALTNYGVSIGYSSASSEIGSIGLGSFVLSQGASSLALGNATTASASNSIAIGTEAVSGYIDSTAIGAFSETTATNQIRLGRAVDHVSIPGELRDVQINGAAFTGTNRFDYAISYAATNIVSLANGANDLDPGFRTYLRVSGPTAAYSIDKIDRGWDGRIIRIQKTDSYTLTIVNNSGAGVLGDAAKILTGTGGNISITNNPGFVELTYDSATSRWGVSGKSN